MRQKEQEASADFRPVYHFQDERLFDTFVRKIPRVHLLEPLRSDSLRNRYFRGFRISDTVPTLPQLITAYRREILESSDGDLANFLCRHWIRANLDLTRAALQSVSISTATAADANTWINEIQAALSTIYGVLSSKNCGLQTVICISLRSALNSNCRKRRQRPTTSSNGGENCGMRRNEKQVWPRAISNWRCASTGRSRHRSPTTKLIPRPWQISLRK